MSTVTNVMYLKNNLILCSLIMVSFSCNSRLNKQAEMIPNDTTEHICFLTFRMTNDTLKANTKLELLQRTITDGSFKADLQDFAEWNSKLQFELFNHDTLVNTFYIEHPLVKKIEYVDGNNQLNTKEIEMLTSDFFIRFQFTGKRAVIKISESLSGKPKKLLSTIKI